MSGDEAGGPPATKQTRVEATGSKPSAPAVEQLPAMIKEAVADVLKEQGVELPKSKFSGPAGRLGIG